MYFLIGGFGGAQRSYAAVKFLLYSLLGGLLMLASVVGLYVVSAKTRRPVVPADRPDQARHEPEHRALAVPRLLLRLRGEGADGAVPHLAAGRRRRGDAGHVGTAGRHPGQDRHLRDDPVLPGPVPERVRVGHPGRPGAGPDQRPVRRAGGDRPDRHQAADRLHLDLALRLHRDGHLRAHLAGPDRIDAVHVQPRPLHRGSVPGGRVPDLAARFGPDRGLRRRREGGSGAGRHLPVRRSVQPGAARVCRRSSPSSWCWPGRSAGTR